MVSIHSVVLSIIAPPRFLALPNPPLIVSLAPPNKLVPAPTKFLKLAPILLLYHLPSVLILLIPATISLISFMLPLITSICSL